MEGGRGPIVPKPEIDSNNLTDISGLREEDLDKTNNVDVAEGFPETKQDFDLELFLARLQESHQELDNKDIDIRKYISAFAEIRRFCRMLGPIFLFAVYDIDSKLTVLEAYLESHQSEVYQKLSTMLDYEKSINFYDDSSRSYLYGSENLLKLHRSFEFIVAFIGELTDLNDDSSSCVLAQDIYQRTLAKHHNWLIQKMTTWAMYILPSRQVLIDIMCKHDKETVLQLSKDIVETGKIVYDMVENEYSKRELLNMA